MLKVKIFYDDYFVNKLAERDASLVKKLISRFKGTIKKSAMVDSESIKYLKKLVSKFEKALDNAQSGVKISQIGNDDEEREFVNVRYSKSNEKSSIREQLKSSIDIINEMQPVAVVNSKNMTKKEVFDFAMEEFKKFGYQVERQNFGKIEIGKKEINDSLNYLNQEGEILVLLSVPKVLKRGALIDGHGNHKGRNYETVTIAAPVVINGVRGNVGVIVKQGGKNKYKTHRILMPDGSEFVFETKNDAEPTSAGVKGENHRQGPAISSTSYNIISENGENVNSNSKKIDDERKSVKRSYEPTEDIQITLQDVQTLRSITQDGKRKSINDFSNAEIQKAEKWARKFYKELGVKSPFFRAWYGDWREHQHNSFVKVVEKIGNNRGEVVNSDTQWSIVISKQVHKETGHHSGSPEKNAVKYLPYIEDITKNAVLLDSVVSNDDNVNSLMYHSLYAYTEVMGYPALLRLKVEELFYHGNNGSGIIKRDYILQNIEEEPISKGNRLSRPDQLETDSSVISISDLFKIVKQYDKDFKPKSVNLLLLNEDGTPKVLYHGTNAEFFEFDKAKIQVDNLGKGFYLADQKKIAESYASRRTEERGGSPKVMEVYLKADKPLHAEKLTREDVKSFYTYQNQKDGDSNEDAIKNAEDDLNYAETVGKKRGWFDGDYSNLVGTNDEYFKEWAISEGYDCFIIPGKDKRTGLEGIAYVVFEPNQIKSATDNIGTFDSSNPDIRYSKQRSYNPFEDVDDEGNKWVESEDENGVKILFSMPDFDNPAYEYNHIPDEEPEIVETYKAVASSSAESDLRKRLADLTKAKVYARNEAKEAFGDIIEEYFEGLNVKFKGKARAEIERMLWNALNSADEGARMSPALDIADAIITNAVVTENYEMTPELELAYAITGYLKTHLHNVNLDHIKGEIKAKYDKDTSVYAMWARKEGERGVTADQIKSELEELIPGIRIDAINEADIFLALDEMYREASKLIKESIPQKHELLGYL